MIPQGRNHVYYGRRSPQLYHREVLSGVTSLKRCSQQIMSAKMLFSTLLTAISASRTQLLQLTECPERKIVKNADHLKVVEQSWRGGNKSLGKPLTKYVRRWMSTGMINHLVNKRSCVQFIHQKCWEIPTTFELTQMSAHMFQQKTGIVPPECRDVAWEIKKFAMINYNFHQMLKYFIHFELALKIP